MSSDTSKEDAVVRNVTFPAWWQRRWGFNGAVFLSYLHQEEPGPQEWFTAEAQRFREYINISHPSVTLAREKLRADGVIDVRRHGPSYEYRLDHDRLAEIEQSIAAAYRTV